MIFCLALLATTFPLSAQSIFSTAPIRGGHTWSAASRFGDMLGEAERLYGPRDKEFTLLGVELTSVNRPQIWFPGGSKNVLIQVPQRYGNDLSRAAVDIAHEVIHCLNPITSQTGASVLEEGVAVHFAYYYCQERMRRFDFDVLPPNYTFAYERVQELLAIDPEAVRKIREVEPSLSLVTTEQLLPLFPALDREAADYLTRRFNALDEVGAF